MIHQSTGSSISSMWALRPIPISRLCLTILRFGDGPSGMYSIKRGMSCAVILPMNIKEGWAINGLMITRPYEGKMRVYPQAKESVYQPRVDILGTEGKFTSEQDLSRLRDEFFAKVNEEIRLTRLAIEKEDVDVLFSYFSTTDGIQHDFWRHCRFQPP